MESFIPPDPCLCTGLLEHLRITTTFPYFRSKAFDNGKQRTLPLWRQTQRLLRQWIRENRLTPPMPLLPNRYGEPLTRFGAFRQIKKLVRRASVKQPTLNQRPISPHLFRHASAMRLLEAGIAPEVIALWLGHETFNTTHQYVEAGVGKDRPAKD